MARWFTCPYLYGEVELTDEREAYILGKHEAALDGNCGFLAGVLEERDEVRQSRTDASARPFVRWI